MKITTKTAILTAALALAASPALALPPVVPGSNGSQHSASDVPSKHTNTPGPHASLPAKAKAYGRYCQSFSKKHVAGTPGTPFSKCVTDMAKLATHKSDSPRHACSDQSKKHVTGEKGTPFSRCVVAGTKLVNDQDNQDS
jgi:hypothetical protein